MAGIADLQPPPQPSVDPLADYRRLLAGMKRSADAGPGVLNIFRRASQNVARQPMIDTLAQTTAPIPVAGDITGFKK